MNKEVRIKINTDGKVEIDSNIFKNCKEVSDHLAKILGKVENFYIKDEMDTEEKVTIDINTN